MYFWRLNNDGLQLDWLINILWRLFFFFFGKKTWLLALNLRITLLESTSLTTRDRTTALECVFLDISSSFPLVQCLDRCFFGRPNYLHKFPLLNSAFLSSLKISYFTNTIRSNHYFLFRILPQNCPSEIILPSFCSVQCHSASCCSTSS